MDRKPFFQTLVTQESQAFQTDHLTVKYYGAPENSSCAALLPSLSVPLLLPFSTSLVFHIFGWLVLSLFHVLTKDGRTVHKIAISPTLVCGPTTLSDVLQQRKAFPRFGCNAWSIKKNMSCLPAVTVWKSDNCSRRYQPFVCSVLFPFVLVLSFFSFPDHDILLFYHSWYLYKVTSGIVRLLNVRTARCMCAKRWRHEVWGFICQI